MPIIEEDAPFLFSIAFLIVTACFVLAIVLLYRKKHIRDKTGVALFLTHWAFTTLAFSQMMCALRPPANMPMVTENGSIMVGWVGIYWAIGVAFLIAGLFHTLGRKN